MNERITKIVVSWFELADNDEVVQQFRKYNNVDKTDAFLRTLSERGVKKARKTVYEEVILEDC